MADGYLEKRMEDYMAGRLKPGRKKFKPRPYPGPPPSAAANDDSGRKEP